MKKLLFSYLLCSIWMGSVCFCGAGGQEDDAKLETVFKTYLEGYFKLRPMDATRLGDHRFDAELDDLRRAAREEWLNYIRKALEELPKQIKSGDLSRNGRID